MKLFLVTKTVYHTAKQRQGILNKTQYDLTEISEKIDQILTEKPTDTALKAWKKQIFDEYLDESQGSSNKQFLSKTMRFVSKILKQPPGYLSGSYDQSAADSAINELIDQIEQ